MLFLKQIRAKGFKSFADLTTLDFTHEMIGVVGPNGSGKSNITDAIRWTLGEQSTKSLRGSNMNDIVFNGSEDKQAAEIAEVTLVFENQRGVFSTIETNMVEITRRFNKKTRDSDFFINGEKCKLRDIQEVALDTGLTKSSLAIISQGTISNFAEAKPDTRRILFDEAAGVAKYKKRKIETVNKLLKAQIDLETVQSIANEIERRLPNLKRQAEKAELFKDKINRLKEIEVSILAKDHKAFTQRIEVLQTEKSKLDKTIKELTNLINLSQDEFDIMLGESSSTEKEMTSLNARFNELVQRISNLKTKKTEADNRENSISDTSNSDNFKAEQIKKTFIEKQIYISTEKDKNSRLENIVVEMRERYDYITGEYNRIFDEIRTIESKIAQYKNKIEFNENQKALGGFNTTNAADFLMKNSKKNDGVIGTLLSLVSVANEYQIAISVAAGGSMNSIVMRTNQDVKKAIEFLKNNNAGRCTFLPLDTLSPKTIQGPQRHVIQQAPGFIGFANDLVQIDNEYQIALDYALGTIVVVNKYDDAIGLAKSTNNLFSIVTLTGERILPRGAIQGGSTNKINLFSQNNTHQTSIEDVKNLVHQLEIKEFEYNKELNDIKFNKDKLQQEISEVQTTIRMSRENIATQINNLKELSEDYRVLTGISLIDGDDDNNEESESIKFARAIAKAEAERDEIQMRLNSLSSLRNQSVDRQKEINQVNAEKRAELDEYKDQSANVNSELTILQQRKIATLSRLSTNYGISSDDALALDTDIIEDEEGARQEIQELATELREIGNVNMDSIEEYKQEKERFDYYDTQLNDARGAIAKLELIIRDIDITMETQFTSVINDINATLPDAFAKLFGGGSAELLYTNPNNILETGIDIRVNPPGKKITNLNLLSGGEKSLVALSVLFSILKVRPLPLVILDEAEAPLDPANVERFSRYVRQFTNDTQFIIVTHREGTMENCDVLFGVTMESRGVTKIVKVNLKDAKILADDDKTQ